MGWEGHELHGGFHVHLGFAARAHETLRFQAHHHPIPADWNCGVQDWWTCHWNMSGSIKLALKWSTGDVWAAQRCDIWPSSGYHWRLSPPVQQGFNKANLAKKTKKQQNHPGLVFTDTLQMFTTRCKQQMWDHQFWLVCGVLVGKQQMWDHQFWEPREVPGRQSPRRWIPFQLVRQCAAHRVSGDDDAIPMGSRLRRIESGDESKLEAPGGNTNGIKYIYVYRYIWNS